MPSILHGYEIDVFISYRQNDNADGWVTEFVSSLQRELNSIIKQELSIYFDSDPGHGISESHDVDGSLKNKIKCLVFIPIVSQTYCDTSSFAWRQEFLSFVQFARTDDYGMDIAVAEGNVIKRVLPVRVHDIEQDDKKLLETELGGFMRPIDFIYRESGVNRPLLMSDSRNKNLEGTEYRNQMNKVAHAVKEIVNSMQRKPQSHQPDQNISKTQSSDVRRKSYTKTWMTIAAVLVLSLLAYLYFQRDKSASHQVLLSRDPSIAVLAFSDQSPNRMQEWLGDGVADEILNVLAQVKGLKVIGKTSSFSFKGKDATIKEIGERLKVANILEGSVSKVGNKIRITAQLIDSETEAHLWSRKYDRDANDIFSIIDEVAQEISRALISELSINDIARIGLNQRPDLGTALNESRSALPDSGINNAYDLYLLSRYYLNQVEFNRGTRNKQIVRAINLLQKAVQLDSTFPGAYAELSRSYALIGYFDLEVDQRIAENKENAWKLAERYARKAIHLEPDNADAVNSLAYIKRTNNWDWEGARLDFQKSLRLEPNNSIILDRYALMLACINQMDSAEYYARAAVELNPLDEARVLTLSRVLAFVGKHKESYQLRKSVFTDLPPNEVDSVYERIEYLFNSKQTDKAAYLLIEWLDVPPQTTETLIKLYQAKGWTALLQKVHSGQYKLASLITWQGAPLDQNFEMLRHAMDDRVGWLVYILVDPTYDRLRSDPRFDEILKQMDLYKYKQ